MHVNPFIPINKAEIQAHIKNKSTEIDIFDTIDSTNNYLKRLFHNNNNTRICIAETMTQGKGRLNRAWHAPFGQNIYFSQLMSLQKDISELSNLSLVVSLAVCKSIETMVNLKQPLRVKWPNDIVVNHSKLSGILIEIKSNINGFCQIVIGIGINVNMTQVTKNDISQSWTSLACITGQTINRNQLCISLINTLEDYINNFMTHGFACFIKEWELRDILFGKEITLLSGNMEFKGLSMGINKQGHLLLNINNKLRSFSSGDTTICK